MPVRPIISSTVTIFLASHRYPFVHFQALNFIPINGSVLPTVGNLLTSKWPLFLCWSVLLYLVRLMAGCDVSRGCGGDAAASEAEWTGKSWPCLLLLHSRGHSPPFPLHQYNNSGFNIPCCCSCSKCERQGHNLFYVDNTAQVRGGLRGMLGEEYRADLVGVLVLNYSKTGGR